jgi:UDP-N-acetylmuramyl pentapeptide phosphotransferase/UDP-N-acetylglucosamine-1-phosphate transferase
LADADAAVAKSVMPDTNNRTAAKPGDGNSYFLGFAFIFLCVLQFSSVFSVLMLLTLILSDSKAANTFLQSYHAEVDQQPDPAT